MKIRSSLVAGVAAGALGFALAPSAAVAHDGAHPFENCTAAYDAGFSNIAKGDRHYGKHLDRDRDGIGCDRPPKDFIPSKDRSDEDTGSKEDSGSKGDGKGDGTEQSGAGLADTGGSGTTPYIAVGGGLVLAAGAGVLVAARKRRMSN
jgi:LPXTG-motif cell wall-anchored protein